MNELALFAGAGGGLLATRWLLGWRTVCYIETAEYPVRVLQARIRDGLFDDAPIWGDARTFDGRPWAGSVDIVTAGFPCQPWSAAGKQLGQKDERNLWPDTIRIVREVGPEWILLENVPNLLYSGYAGTVFGELAESGYDARWDCIPASAIGANHQRDRLWIVAHARGVGRGENKPGLSARERHVRGETVANPDGKRCNCWASATRREAGYLFGRSSSDGESQTMADTNHPWRWWTVEPDVGRVADGVAHRVDRIRALGQGQVPAVVAIVWQLLGEF